MLVVAAHPDDDILGCGGAMAKYVDSGMEVRVSFLADGVSARADDGVLMEDERQARHEAAEAACAILGTERPTFSDLPDNQLDRVPLLQVTKIIERLIKEHEPETVLTHHAGDLNIDHRVVHQAVVTACRPQSDHPVKTLLFFEVPSSTEWQTAGTAPPFLPNWFEDISSTLERKLRALQEYGAELREWPHPRSLQAVEMLARWRGATVGVEAAEALMLGRLKA